MARLFAFAMPCEMTYAADDAEALSSCAFSPCARSFLMDTMTLVSIFVVFFICGLLPVILAGLILARTRRWSGKERPRDTRT